MVKHRPLMTIGILELIDEYECVFGSFILEPFCDLGRITNYLIIICNSQFIESVPKLLP